MKAEKLYPPGTVYWINGIEDDNEDIITDKSQKSNSTNTKISLYEVEDVETVFSDITFSTSMFTDQ
jgi:hypothetical protein